MGNEAGDGDVETPCLVVGFTEGKTVAVGAIDYAGVLRHKDPLLCPIMSLAMYLFVRYELNHEAPPDFNNRQSWYQTKLLLGKQSMMPLTYATQAGWVRRVFNEAGISSRKVTHTMRGASARHADAQGVPEEQVIQSPSTLSFIRAIINYL